MDNHMPLLFLTSFSGGTVDISGTPVATSPVITVPTEPAAAAETTLPIETTLETVAETIAETTAATLETTAETIAETIAETLPIIEENTIHFSQLFTRDAGFMGVWIILLTALIAAVLTAVAYTLILKFRKRRPSAIAPTVHVEQTTMPGAATGTAVGHIQVGKVHGQGAREYQQDSFSVTPVESLDTYGVLAVVADGMGGLKNGELVSQTAVGSVVNGFLSAPIHSMEITLWELLQNCNTDVNRVLGRDNLKKSGSTLVTGILRGSQFLWASIGDSRIYLWRNGILTQLNREHIYLHELQLKAVNGFGTLREAYTHPKKGGLTSYLGRGELKHLDMPAKALEVRSGDVLLLMSDGVYNAMTEQELMACLQGTAQEMADALGAVIEEKAHPHQDNYTAVVLKLEAAGEGDA